MPRAACAGSISTMRAARCCRAYPYAELRDDALANARRLIARGIAPGDRVALVAETGAGIRRLVLRRDLCRRLAGAAAAADIVRRARFLYRPAQGAAEQLRSEAAFLPGRTRLDGRRRRPRNAASRASTGRAFADEPAPAAPLPRRRRPTISPICNIRADRPASRTASPSPTAPAQQSGGAFARHGSRSRPTAASRGCPGITTWGWSAACSRRSPTRFRPTISRPRISRAGRSPGSI